MKSARYKLGNLLTYSDERNSEGLYQLNSVKGISIKKEFIETKADMTGVSLNPYKLVKPESFAYVTVTSRNGEKITIAFNDSLNTYIVSSSYEVFKVARTDVLVPEYLFMYFNRSEFDRYSRFNSWGSARETFSWDDMCDIDIELPPVEIQQKYVDIYLGLLKNQQSYEKGLDDLKLTCDGFIEDIRKKLPLEKIGPYIHRFDERNGKNGSKNVMGISVSKNFRVPTSKVDYNKLENYKIVKPRQIAFVQTTNNEKVLAYAFNDTNEDILVSSVNEVFSIDEDILLPEYLCLFLNRKEFDRYARYHSWGSARETFNWEDMCDVKIPIPDIKIQKSIANIYKAYVERSRINDLLKEQIKNICPILIKGSIEEARG